MCIVKDIQSIKYCKKPFGMVLYEHTDTDDDRYLYAKAFDIIKLHYKLDLNYWFGTNLRTKKHGFIQENYLIVDFKVIFW